MLSPETLYQIEQFSKHRDSMIIWIGRALLELNNSIRNMENAAPTPAHGYNQDLLLELRERRTEAQKDAHTIHQQEQSLKAKDNVISNLVQRNDEISLLLTNTEKELALHKAENKSYYQRYMAAQHDCAKYKKSVQDSLKEAQDKHAALTEANEQFNSMAAALEDLKRQNSQLFAELECARGDLRTLEQIHGKTVAELDSYKNSKPQANVEAFGAEVYRVAKSVDDGIAMVDSLLEKIDYPPLPTPASSSRADDNYIQPNETWPE